MRQYGSAVICAAISLLVLDSASALDRFHLDAPPAAAGATGVEVRVLCDNDTPALAFSFGVRWDPAALEIVDVARDPTGASAAADFFAGRIDPVGGVVGWGCVFDLSGGAPENRLQPGTDQELARLVVDVAAAPPPTTELRFENVAADVARPEVLTRNVLTNESGQSVLPETEDATLEIHYPPRVDGLEDASGFEGTRFTVLGAHFDEPGLVVRVGGVEAAHEPPTADGTRVVVVAPPCAELGDAGVEVCTDLGCATAPEAFVCERAGPSFVRGDCNGDGADLGVADAIHMLAYAFQGGERPPCIAACDANGDGAFGGEPSDAVFVLLFAFAGGAAPGVPFPECGPSGPVDLAFGCESPPATCL